MHCSPLRFGRSVLAILLVAMFSSGTAIASEASLAKPAEYMIYQYPDVSLVIVVDAREVQFSSRIEGPEGALVSEAGVPGRRIGPVYQLVEAVARPRQLMIEVNPAQRVERSRISMELLQLPDTDRNAAALARAYRFLAHGMKSAGTEGSAAWAARIYSLRNASQAFASLGMEEMTLWSEHYAAHLMLYGIGDYQLAIERARAVRTAASRAGFETVGFASSILEAEALMASAGELEDRAANERFRLAGDRWERVAEQAASLGFRAEHGRALYQGGIAHQRQGQLDEAVRRYEAALAVTSEAADLELLNEIRATAAAAYELRGSTCGAIDLLDEIASELDPGTSTAEQELAVNLYEKGRLLNSTFRFALAAADLERSLQLLANSPDDSYRGLASLELARAYHARGESDRAGTILGRSLSWLSRSNGEARASALGLLALIAREDGRFTEMAEFRAQQSQWLEVESSRAAFLFESALDAIEKEGPASATAERLLTEARDKAAGSDMLSGHRAGLYLCLVQLRRGGCDPDRVADSHDVLRRGGIPTVAVDAGLVWTTVLDLAGREAAARASAERLLDSVQFYRERLPGVIAAWYGSHRDELFSLYLSLERRASPTDHLVALNRVRDLERAGSTPIADEGRVRGAIARVVGAQPTPDDVLSRQSHRELRTFREASGWISGALDADRLKRLLADLERGESILAYVFRGQRLELLTATSKGVTRQRIPGADRVRQLIRNVRAAMLDPTAPAPVSDLDALGGLLVAPLGQAPGRYLYLMPFGPLNGFPFDAVRLEGRFLAESHRIVNLDSLSALESPRAAPIARQGSTMFLAGNPRTGRDLFTYGVSTSKEISAVRDRFIGEGLHIVQGVALRSDEFEDERYAEAELIHLAMPGRVDLARPERSRLLLSGERETPSTEFLSPANLRSMPVDAQLAVLSGTAFAESPGSDFDSRLGLVGELQAAGASQVLASLWPAGDEENAAFMADFYSELESGKPVSEALHETRKSRIDPKNDTNIRRWAGFQLFIR